MAERFSEDEAARHRIRVVVEQHFDLVWRSACRLGMSPADADDVAQEVFVVLARRLSDVEPGRERSFLFSTLVRTISTRRRSMRRRAEEPFPFLSDGEMISSRAVTPLSASPEEMNELRAARPLLREVLEAIPDEQRTVFVLFELEELRMVEIAEALSIPLGTVKSRLKSARAAFRRHAKRVEQREGFAPGVVVEPAEERGHDSHPAEGPALHDESG